MGIICAFPGIAIGYISLMGVSVGYIIKFINIDYPINLAEVLDNEN